MRRLLTLLVLALPAFGALQGVIYSDLAANLVNNRAWIKNYPLYGFWSLGSTWTNMLDCTGSTGATGGIASCDWSRVSGPSTLTFGSPNGTTTTVTGAVFGQYVIQAVVHDGMGNTSTVTQMIGATSCDSNGVLVPRSADFTTWYGSVVCMGRNPYGASDERNLKSLLQRNITYSSVSPYSSYTFATNPDFAATQTGSINYVWMGVGFDGYGTTGTTLASDFASTDTVMHINTPAILNLTSFPTRIQLHTGSSPSAPTEDVEVCSTTATSGATADLTVCYAGRGITGSGNARVLGPTSWSAATAKVGQEVVVGTGTSFTSTLCPAGAGPLGPVKYSTGTADFTAGSTSVVGHSTLWNTGSDSNYRPAVNDIIRFGGATHSATPFVFWGYVAAINSDTSITLSQAFPSSADTASGVTYQIIRPYYRQIVTGFTRKSPYLGTGTAGYVGTYCEDNTHAFYGTFVYPDQGYYDIAGLNNTGAASGTYSFFDGFGGYLANAAGVNYYGENLAWTALFERSGLTLADTMADYMTSMWIKYPAFVGGYAPGASASTTEGGGRIGAAVRWKLYGTPSINDMRPIFAWGVVTIGCDSLDTRDTGYIFAPLSLGALWDPDTTSTDAPGGIPWRTYWRNMMQTVYTRDNSCKNTIGGSGVYQNSWMTSYNFLNAGGPTVSATNGSNHVTSSSAFSGGSCQGVETGVATVTAGSQMVTATGAGTNFNGTGTFTSTVGSIMLGGKYFQLYWVDSTHGTISGQWPGSSGSVNYMTLTPTLYSDAGPAQTVIGLNGTDYASLAQNYQCIFENSSSVWLDRPFAGTTSASNVMSVSTVDGYLQQSLMLPIFFQHMRIGALMDGALSTDFTTLSANAATWQTTYGYNLENLTSIYERGPSNCESGGSLTGQTYSYTTPNSGATFAWRNPTCSVGSWIPTVVENRQINQETFPSTVRWYQNNTNPTNLATVNSLYCAVWCQTGWNAPGITDDPLSVMNNLSSSNLTDAQLLNGKIAGQMWGMGNAPSWAAVQFSSSSGGGSISAGSSVQAGNGIRH